MTKPNCYDCVHRRPVNGDLHSVCSNTTATATGEQIGIKNGWFFWPINFDPQWIIACDGFKLKTED